MFARSEMNRLVARFDSFRDSLRPRERSSSEGDAPFVLNFLFLAEDFSISSLIVLALVAASRRKSIRMHEGSDLVGLSFTHLRRKENRERTTAVPFIPFPESYLHVEHLDVKLRDESR